LETVNVYPIDRGGYMHTNRESSLLCIGYSKKDKGEFFLWMNSTKEEEKRQQGDGTYAFEEA
jgi:hypothetical protein